MSERTDKISDMLHIPAGVFPGFSSENKFGRNASVDGTEDVWDFGGAYRFPIAASTVVVVSASTQDNQAGAGLGAYTVKLIGLDGDYASTTDTVTMNGTTGVETTSSFLRLHRMAVISASSIDATNIGAISATNDVGDTMAQISATFGQTLMAIYTVKAGCTAFMTQYYVSSDRVAAGASIDVNLFVRPFGEVFQVKNHQGLMTDGSSHLVHPFRPYFKISEKSDIKIEVTSSKDDSDVAAGFDLVLVEELL